MERIVRALQKLNQAGISYCLLRNYQFLIGGEIGSDVDLAIREEDKQRTTEVLSEAGFYKRAGHSKRKHTFYNGYAGDCEVTKLDVSWDGSEYNGLPTVDIDRLLSNRHRLNGCWIPSDEDYFVQIVFHGAIKKSGYREGYRQDIRSLVDSVDQETVRTHAADLFGKIGVKAVELALDGNLESIPKLKWQLVIAGCLNQRHVVPEFLYILFYENNIRNVFKRIRKKVTPPPKPIIVVTGPDGAGKSTLTENAVEKFEELGYDVHLAKLGLTNDSAIVMDIAKHLYNRFSSYDVEEVKKKESRGEKTLGDRDGFHKAVIHYIDIVLRYRHAKRTDADLILADRYIHDVGIYDQPGPLRLTFKWFESEHVYPFLLTGDPEVLAERSEYTTDSLSKLVERYDSLEFERLDATNDPERVLEEFFEKVLIDEDVLRHL